MSESEVRLGAYAALSHFRRRLASDEPLTKKESAQLAELLLGVEEHMQRMWDLVGDV